MLISRTRVFALLGCVALTGAVVAAAPGRAYADPTPPCYGSSCYGKDPQATGCAGDNAISVASFEWDGVSVTLRYSNWCHANWASASTLGIGAEFLVQNKDASHNIEQWGFGSGSYAWTDMIDGTVLARACIDQGNNYYYPCTGWN